MSLNDTGTKFHELLHKIVTEGVPLLDAGGNPIIVDGKPVMGPPPAAWGNVIRGVLKDNNITCDTTQKENPLVKTAEKIRSSRQLPALTEEDDAAAA